MTEKRFNIEFDGHRYFVVIDEDNERCLARLDTRLDASAWLEIYEMLSEENEQLKKENKELTISLNCERERHLKTHNENEDLKSQLKHLRKLSNELYMETKE